jgi:hypothetical protein
LWITTHHLSFTGYNQLEIIQFQGFAKAIYEKMLKKNCSKTMQPAFPFGDCNAAMRQLE